MTYYSLGGEGLFAKKDLFQGEIVALYNGIKVKEKEKLCKAVMFK